MYMYVCVCVCVCVCVGTDAVAASGHGAGTPRSLRARPEQRDGATRTLCSGASLFASDPHLLPGAQVVIHGALDNVLLVCAANVLPGAQVVIHGASRVYCSDCVRASGCATSSAGRRRSDLVER